MVNKCDICGFDIEPKARYCGGCNVDLQEPKGHDEPVLKMGKSIGLKGNNTSNEKKTDDENVINWCTVKELFNSHIITYPHFFFLVILLASGKTKLGFCDCAVCNQRFRMAEYF